VKGARIVTTRSVDEDMEHVMPASLVTMLDRWQEWEGGDFMHQVFGAFDFRGITITHATETFESALKLKVGNKDVHLIDVGPAHTKSDILVYLPEDKIVYTGDILFAGAHPAIWSGPVGNWIKACDLMLGWDVDVIVPGHGPIVGKDAVRSFKAYLEYIWEETRKRYEAGMGFLECAFDITMGEFDDWGDAERMIPNIMTIYGELSGTRPVIPREELWAQMGRYYKQRRARRAEAAGCPGCTDPGHSH
jgi:glyoxylase-like metal-dependent hydrolase (beta-lactamase superfamily II)